MIPHILACRSLNTTARQFRGYGVWRHTLKEQAENQTHDFCLFGINYKPVELKTTSYSWETSNGYTRNDVCGTLEWEESAASEAGNSRYINLASVYAAHGQAVEKKLV